MRVLFQIRRDYLKNIAGDSIIFENIRKNLINEGVEIHVCTESNINPLKYDLIHVFNSVRVDESYEFIKNSRRYNKKIVLTPIYWDLKYYFHQTNQIDRLQSWNRAEEKRRFIFNNVDCILPHCFGELELIRQNYGTDSKSVIVPFGTDLKFKEGNRNYLKSKFGIGDCILCVGRINRQKNQLSLIKALSKENIPIVLVGTVNDRSYCNQCIKEGKDKIIILDKIETGQLSSIYKSAKVHALPSWVEYPGLASLEAGMAECNVVTTAVGSTREVFRDYVNYCNPRDIGSICNEIMNAYESDQNENFKNFIIEKFLWTKIARKIKEVYLSII